MEIAYSIGKGNKIVSSYGDFRKYMDKEGLDLLMSNEAVLYLYPSMDKTSAMMLHYEYKDDDGITSHDLVLTEDIQRLLDKHKHEKKSYRLVMTPRGVNLFYTTSFVNTASYEELRNIFKVIREKLNVQPDEFFIDKPYAFLGYDKDNNFLYIPSDEIGKSARNNLFGKDMSLYDRSYYEYILDELQSETVSRMQFFKNIVF